MIKLFNSLNGCQEDIPTLTISAKDKDGNTIANGSTTNKRNIYVTFEFSSPPSSFYESDIETSGTLKMFDFEEDDSKKKYTAEFIGPGGAKQNCSIEVKEYAFKNTEAYKFEYILDTVIPTVTITAKNSKGEILPRTDMPAIAPYKGYGNLGNDTSITLTFTVEEEYKGDPLDEESGGTITFNDSTVKIFGQDPYSKALTAGKSNFKTPTYVWEPCKSATGANPGEAGGAKLIATGGTEPHGITKEYDNGCVVDPGALNPAPTTANDRFWFKKISLKSLKAEFKNDKNIYTLKLTLPSYACAYSVFIKGGAVKDKLGNENEFTGPYSWWYSPDGNTKEFSYNYGMAMSSLPYYI